MARAAIEAPAEDGTTLLDVVEDVDEVLLVVVEVLLVVELVVEEEELVVVVEVVLEVVLDAVVDEVVEVELVSCVELGVGEAEEVMEGTTCRALTLACALTWALGPAAES